MWNSCYYELCKRILILDEEKKNEMKEKILNMQLIHELLPDFGKEKDIFLNGVEMSPDKVVRGDNVIKGIYEGLNVAIKKIHVSKDKVEELKVAFFKICNEMPSPLLIKVFGLCQFKNEYHLVMEWYEVNLHDLLHSGNYKIGDKMKSQIIGEILTAIAWLFKSKKLHLNIKPTNILLDSRYKVKLSDFHELTEYTTPVYNIYQPPEYYATEDRDFASDLFSFGIILWEILNNKDPIEYDNTEKAQMFGKEIRKPEWISDLKIDGYKRIYDVCTIFDKSQRTEKLLTTTFHEENMEYPFVRKVGDEVSVPGLTRELQQAQNSLRLMPSEVGAYIWEKSIDKNSKSTESTQWENFYDQFQSKFSVVMNKQEIDTKYQCFRLILNTRASSTINKKIWENFSNWFSEYLTSDDKVNELINWIHDAYKNYWFHGFLDEEKITERLKAKEILLLKKTTQTIFYCIRFSNVPGVFSLHYIILEKSSTPTIISKEDITVNMQQLDKVIPELEKYIRDFTTKYKRFTIINIESSSKAIFEEVEGIGYQDDR